MGPKELKELKEQLDELESKGFIQKVYHLGVRLLYLLIKEMEAEECVGISGI
jgi:hypothetical protein